MLVLVLASVMLHVPTTLEAVTGPVPESFFPHPATIKRPMTMAGRADLTKERIKTSCENGEFGEVEVFVENS
jgi:hypothetical protein